VRSTSARIGVGHGTRKAAEMRHETEHKTFGKPEETLGLPKMGE
jgi:hypothetical protein